MQYTKGAGWLATAGVVIVAACFALHSLARDSKPKALMTGTVFIGGVPAINGEVVFYDGSVVFHSSDSGPRACYEL
jgi:hypothetical protein